MASTIRFPVTWRHSDLFLSAPTCVSTLEEDLVNVDGNQPTSVINIPEIVVTKKRNRSSVWQRLTVILPLLSYSGGVACSTAPRSAQPLFDLVIENGHIIDGTGSPWYAADVGIRDGKIAAIGHLAGPATRRIDAHGKVVAPGFIDMLGQSELTILVNPQLPSKIFQGITTEITGEGGSIAPLNDAIIAADHVAYEHYRVTPDWRTLARGFARLEKQGMGINLAPTSARRRCGGWFSETPISTPNEAELNRMKALVRAAMEEGAVGLRRRSSTRRHRTRPPRS